MDRTQRAKQAFDYSSELTLENEWYKKQVQQYLLGALEFDAQTDITTELFPDSDKEVTAVLLAKESGILAGCMESEWLCKKESVKIEWKKKDGENIQTKEEIALLTGSMAHLMRVERTMLNTLQRMSGIATETKSIIDLVGTDRDLSLPFICATRKTLWGALDKKAVAVGGGATHRLGLWDGILIKDNHIDSAGGIDQLQKIVGAQHFVPMKTGQLREIEADSIEQAQEIMEAKLHVNAIMFDNFSPEQIREILAWAKEKELYDQYLFEASGGINEKNIQEYASTGVDVISLGSLTHSVRALDISLNIA